MPDAIITSTASTFGTISGTFAADQSTITGTVSGIITGTLDGSVGVPGVGVPDGGTTGQVLQKATNTSYDTVWATPSGVAWGTITGTLSNQTDLQTALNLKAPLASPALTGNPTAPTAALGDNDTSLATTAFVQQELLSGTANAKNLEVYVRNQTGSTLAAGTIVYINGATGNRPTVTPAQANNDANSAQTFGFVKTSIANNGFGFVIVRGELENIDTSALTEGVQLYLSPTTAGTWTTTKPSAPQHLVYVGIVVRAHPTQGVILVAVQNGFELDELHDVQITSPTNGQVLKYNSSTSLWYNGTDSAGVAWGGITGTLSSQTDLQTALDGKYSTTNPAGYITSSALTGYATETFVTSQGYITSSALTPYLTSATAASTYSPIASPTFTGLATFDNPGNYAISVPASGVGYDIRIEGQLVSMRNASTEVIRISPGGIKYPDGVTQSVAFPGTSGFLLKADNLSGLANTGTARTNLGLGTMAVETASNYLTTATAASTYQTLSGMSSYLTTSTAASTYQPISGMSSYLTTASAASTYFTIASAANKADLASPTFTGVPAAPTAAAATNTTQIATTAFVQQEVPAASTTAAGKVELATLAEIITGTDTARVMPVSQIPAMTASPYLRALAAINATSVSGAAAVTAASGEQFSREAYLTSGAAGRASFQLGFAGTANAQPVFHTANFGQINFSNKIVVSGTTVFGITGYPGNASTQIYVTLGGYNASTTGDMTQKGIGIKKVGGTSSVIQLIVHNGTSQTSVSTSVTSALAEAVNWTIYSDGTGNVTLYINGSQAATTSAGPTGTNTAGNSAYREQVECPSGGGTNHSIHSVGGWVYIRP